MLITTIARKPLSEPNVALNVLAHGTGALNIDASRLRTDDNLNGGAYSQDASARHDGVENWRYKRGEAGEYKKPTGRWPANTILQHLPGCEYVGTKIGQPRSGHHKLMERKSPSGKHVYGSYKGGGMVVSHNNDDGTETVPAWECVSGCPVLGLDEQSGTSKASGFVFEAGDTGASRYFKQIGAEQSMSEITQDFLDYLYQMITPEQGSSLVTLDLTSVDWASIPDGQYHGLIGRGTPSDEVVAEMWRVVKPGAHVLLIAPDDSPVGFEGACALEDRGFEIRDAILLVQEAGKTHYVAKANAKDRSQGCEALAHSRNEAKYALTPEALEDEDIGSVLIDGGLETTVIDTLLDGGGVIKEALTDSVRKHCKKMPSEGKYGNNHPTTKPVNVMIRLLGDVPKEALVMDPFLGSGTTGVACVLSGHDFLGIELSPEYIQIADARVRYHDKSKAGWVEGAEIVSEAVAHQGVAADLSEGVFDLF